MSNGLAEILFNGEKIGVKYGLPAMRFIYDKLDTVAFLSSETYSLVSIVQIVHSGYINYCLIKEIVPSISFESFFEWVEDNESPDEIRKAIDAFNDSKYIKQTKDLTEEVEKKSPSTGKKSKKQPTAK